LRNPSLCSSASSFSARAAGQSSAYKHPAAPRSWQELVSLANSLSKVITSFCIDWNDFTDLRVMRPKTAIAVITGQGAHKPDYSPADPRYKSNVFLIGGLSPLSTWTITQLVYCFSTILSA
jgi:hypothetical protein